jgi:hypothetical protein
MGDGRVRVVCASFGFMHPDEVPAGLEPSQQLIFMVGAVARARAALVYDLVQTSSALSYLGGGDPDTGDLSWRELFDLTTRGASQMTDARLREGILDTIAAAQQAKESADAVVDGLWFLDSSDPDVWNFAGSGLGLAARIGHEPSSLAGFVEIVNATSAAIMRIGAIRLLASARNPATGESLLPDEITSTQWKILEGRFTVKDDGTPDTASD